MPHQFLQSWHVLHSTNKIMLCDEIQQAYILHGPTNSGLVLTKLNGFIYLAMDLKIFHHCLSVMLHFPVWNLCRTWESTWTLSTCCIAGGSCGQKGLCMNTSYVSVVHFPRLDGPCALVIHNCIFMCFTWYWPWRPSRSCRWSRMWWCGHWWDSTICEHALWAALVGF